MRTRFCVWAAGFVSSALVALPGLLFPFSATATDIQQILIGPLADSCDYCVCNGGTVKPQCQSCCSSSSAKAQASKMSKVRGHPPAALFNMSGCPAEVKTSSEAKGSSTSGGVETAGWNPYPCCTHCDNCRNECVSTDSNGNCTHWKNHCDCERHCPCDN